MDGDWDKETIASLRRQIEEVRQTKKKVRSFIEVLRQRPREQKRAAP